MIAIRRERYDDVIEEIKPLLVEHWKEIATYREAIPFDADYARYRYLDETGKLIILTARDFTTLVGYSIMFLLNHPHYKSTLFAMNDIIYIRPDKRGGSAGVRLIEASEQAAKDAGAVKIGWHVKLSHNFSPMLERRGYDMEEVNMAKLL